MTEVYAKSPTVFTVDSGPPPLPPRTRTRRRQLAPSQVLLLLLVSVALCGMLVEAWLIHRLYRLYQPAPGEASQPSALKMIGNAPTVGSKVVEWDKRFEAPFKPLAHLTDGPDVKAHHKYIMSWSEVPDLFLYKVEPAVQLEPSV
uniref:Uncharacterized protein n=1 Tax=Knipowitschia caucasica TaxID=637954 RepID=A0AAV2KJJ8_KNICA